MPSNYVMELCGSSVDRLRTGLVKTLGSAHSGVLCTNFVRSLWVNKASYNPYSRRFNPQIFVQYISVIGQLYPISTGLINTTSSKSNT